MHNNLFLIYIVVKREMSDVASLEVMYPSHSLRKLGPLAILLTQSHEPGSADSPYSTQCSSGHSSL